jgi:hypothetical protein
MIEHYLKKGAAVVAERKEQERLRQAVERGSRKAST